MALKTNDRKPHYTNGKIKGEVRRKMNFSHVKWWLRWNDKRWLANQPAGCSNSPWPFERERVRMAKIKETERVRIQSVPAFFQSRVTSDASACEKHFPPVISGESGRRPPPRRFAPRGRTSPYSPEMTGGTYISHLLGFVVLRNVVKVFPVSSSFARKTTQKNRARSHSGARRGLMTKWDLKLVAWPLCQRQSWPCLDRTSRSIASWVLRVGQLLHLWKRLSFPVLTDPSEICWHRRGASPPREAPAPRDSLNFRRPSLLSGNEFESGTFTIVLHATPSFAYVSVIYGANFPFNIRHVVLWLSQPLIKKSEIETLLGSPSIDYIFFCSVHRAAVSGLDFALSSPSWLSSLLVFLSRHLSSQEISSSPTASRYVLTGSLSLVCQAVVSLFHKFSFDIRIISWCHQTAGSLTVSACWASSVQCCIMMLLCHAKTPCCDVIIMMSFWWLISVLTVLFNHAKTPCCDVIIMMSFCWPVSVLTVLFNHAKTPCCDVIIMMSFWWLISVLTVLFNHAKTPCRDVIIMMSFWWLISVLTVLFNHARTPSCCDVIIMMSFWWLISVLTVLCNHAKTPSCCDVIIMISMSFWWFISELTVLCNHYRDVILSWCHSFGFSALTL